MVGCPVSRLLWSFPEATVVVVVDAPVSLSVSRASSRSQSTLPLFLLAACSLLNLLCAARCCCPLTRCWRIGRGADSHLYHTLRKSRKAQYKSAEAQIANRIRQVSRPRVRQLSTFLKRLAVNWGVAEDWTANAWAVPRSKAEELMWYTLRREWIQDRPRVADILYMREGQELRRWTRQEAKWLVVGE